MSNDSDLTPHIPPVVEADALPATLVTSKPGPNVFIAFAWLIGVFVAQALLTLIAMGIWYVTTGDMNADLDEGKMDSSPWGGLLVLAASQLGTGGVALAAAAVHCRRNLIRRLRLNLPEPRHWLFAMLAVVPVSILATEMATIVGQLDGFSLKTLADSMSFFSSIPLAGVLLFACVFPGLFEELLLRGVIGEALVRRHGAAFGVAVASFYFGLLHVLPAHAASSAVIGVFLHLAMLYSRSFWIPVAMHTTNNALAFILERNEDLMPIPGYTTPFDEETLLHVPAPILACGALATAWLFICWRVFRMPAEAAAPTASRGRWLLLAGLVVTQVVLFGVLAASVERP